VSYASLITTINNNNIVRGGQRNITTTGLCLHVLRIMYGARRRRRLEWMKRGTGRFHWRYYDADSCVHVIYVYMCFIRANGNVEKSSPLCPRTRRYIFIYNTRLRLSRLGRMTGTVRGEEVIDVRQQYAAYAYNYIRSDRRVSIIYIYLINWRTWALWVKKTYARISISFFFFHFLNNRTV